MSDETQNAEASAAVGCYVDPKHPENAATVIAIGSDIIAHLAEVASPIGFTDPQFEMLLLAAAALPRERRDGFLRAVASHLGRGAVDDGDVLLAINEALHQ
jgi:hypothetical protein